MYINIPTIPKAKRRQLIQELISIAPRDELFELLNKMDIPYYESED